MILNSDVTQSTIQTATNVIDYIGSVQTVWEVVSVLLLAGLLVWIVLTFRKRINNITQKQINLFMTEGKYIPQLYIEVSSSMEYLRFFTHGKKWKKRIVNSYNLTFKGYDGKKIVKILKPKSKTRLSRYQRIDKIRNTMINISSELESVKNHKTHTYEEIGDTSFALRSLTYGRLYSLNQCILLCDLIKAKNLIVVGSAGNGKTNLLCRLSQMLIDSKIPCLLVNAKEINTNCTDYIKNQLPLGKCLRNHSDLFLRLMNFVLKVRRRSLFIIIDAINENDREIFVESIGRLLDDFSNFSCIQIILSCRSEYFDSRYMQYFKDCKSRPYKLRLDEISYNDRAKEKLLSVYSEYYNVHTVLPLYVKEKLLCSLLLMRIFFEVNEGQGKNNLELRNAEIYKMYIDMVSSKASGLDLYDIMNKISKLMVESFSFDNVKITDLYLSSRDLDCFRNCLDNNLIISRKLIKGNGITERNYEVIYFVFDELRDFCLSRYLLVNSEENDDNSYKFALDFIDKLFKEKLSPLEGILKYTYYYLKKELNDSICELLLKKYGFSDARNFYNCRNYLSHKRLFNNMGLSLIFADFYDVRPFELDYITKYIIENPAAFWNIFRIHLQNELTLNNPSIELVFDILLTNHSYDDIYKIISFFFDDKHKPYLYLSIDEARKIDHLCSALDKIKEQNGDLSFELKQFMLLISAIEPDEFLLEEYQDLALNNDVFNALKSRVNLSEICDKLDDLKTKLSTKSTDNKKLIEILKFLKNRGGS